MCVEWKMKSEEGPYKGRGSLLKEGGGFVGGERKHRIAWASDQIYPK